jgi:hypothetical protein
VLILSSLGAAAVIVLVVVIVLAARRGGGTSGPPTVIAQSTAAPTAPAVAPTTPPAPAPGQSAPAGCTPIQPPAGALGAGLYGVGQTATVVGDGQSSTSTYTARITLNSACSSTSPVEQYGDPPKNGEYVMLNITVQVLNGSTMVYPIDFYGQTADGTVYTATVQGVDHEVNQDELDAGQKVTGFVVLDVPANNRTAYWKPLFATSPAGFEY